jgi:hypothetical protein
MNKIRSRSWFAIGLVLASFMITGAVIATVYDPSENDPRIMAALAAEKRLQEVMLAVDMPSVEQLMAPDLVVNAPINKVVDRANVLARLKASQISYEPNVVRNIDFAGVRGDMVVIMGEEITHPNKNAPYAGKTEHRRFTDVWKPFGGVWKLWFRQATITKTE